MNRRYRTLVEVVKLGSLTKAAEKTGYTQSGVTHLLNSLEAEWGVTLVSRDHNGVTATSDGAKLLPFVLDVLSAEEALQEQIDACKRLETGSVSIGSFNSVSAHALPRVIRSFKEAYPGIEFDIRHGTYADIEAWLHEGSVDVGFLPSPVKTGFESFFFYRDRILAMLPEGFDAPDEGPLPVSELERRPFIMLEEGDGNRFRSYLRDNGVNPTIGYTVQEDVVAMAMVESGLGIGLDYELSLCRNPYRIVVRELDPPAYREIHVAVKRTRKVSPIVGTFLEFLADGGRRLLEGA